MSSFKIIQRKLEQFIKKFYTNELIKGTILFFSIGLLYFIVTLLIEYFLWLDPASRIVLFWSFVGVEFALFVRFIAFPLLKLFKLQKGIGEDEAASIIGNHFPEVNDKLLNVIQLNRNIRESDLLAASIDQKAAQLQPVPFQSAVNFKKNAKYLKYAAIPIVVFLAFTLFGGKDLFSSSYDRVLNYNVAYEPPAPFSFRVLNKELKAIENKPYTLRIQTEGTTVPENARINYNNETYYLEQRAPGLFEYTFSQPIDPVTFTLSGNKVSSKKYVIDVVKTPSLVGFEMQLDYPNYTGKRDEVLKSTGNATVPEGTAITWNVTTKNTESVTLKTKDTAYIFEKENTTFRYNRGIYRSLDYAITTSNRDLKDYENLSFTLGVMKDAYPEITVQSKRDSTDSERVYFLGKVSDDYGLTKLQLVYYPAGEEDRKETVALPINKSNIDQFFYTFPGNLDLKDGVAYDYYFEVFDNDAIHRFKSAKSSLFSFKKLTQDERENEQLEQQENTIKGLDKSLNDLKEQEKRLDELSKIQKEKKELNYNDKKKLEQFIKRQKQQEQMMKNFSKELKENLENFQPEEQEDEFKEQLKDRLEENEKKLEENEKLLEELEKLQEKIQKEDLNEKLEKLAKQNKNQEKNLEQLLELTKRYYVTKKAEKLAEEIFELGEEQEKLAEETDKNTKEAQEKLNEKFEEYQKEMEELKKENEGLKEPMDIPQDKTGEKQVKEEQQKATENLDQQKKQDAKKNQKKAGEKMIQMGQQMQSSMAAGQMESIEEDAEMLRQILDNLVVFSFEQENLMEEFKVTDYGNPIFGKKLNIQNDLKTNFEHIDDSLFALSLRQPMISEPINESLTNVAFNIDKSMERLAENQMRQGISSQQYTVTGANELAVLLSDMLKNMQNQMQSMGQGQGMGKGQGQGQGEGRGFQLPDIIEKQESLSEKMKQGLGKKPGPGKDGEGEGEGEGKGQGQGEGQENGGGDGNNGQGEGNNGEGDDGTKGSGNSEESDGELYEIYKQQQQLRQQLEDKLSKEGLRGKGGELLRQMEGVEQQLLDKGFNERTLERMLNLQYEMLKLDEANFEQGQETRREARTNRREYSNTLRLSPEDVKQYFNTTEILNRESLPLRQEYMKRVQTYFNKKDD